MNRLDGPDAMIAIGEANTIPLWTAEDNVEEDESEMGMFEVLCRVNHSCVPNAGWRWDAERRVMSE